MNVNIAKWILQNEAGVCTASTLLEHSGLTSAELRGLIDNGVILPLDEADSPPLFRLPALVLARKARRLRDDFELDLHGLVLALTLIRRIDQLQQELQRAHAGLQGEMPGTEAAAETGPVAEAAKAANSKAGPPPGRDKQHETTGTIGSAGTARANRSPTHF